MRADASLACIPVIVLTSSAASQDVEAAYSRGANAFVVKPQELDDFMDLIGTIRGFWLGVARLPSG
jgi:CheY-like chemotaxis protein